MIRPTARQKLAATAAEWLTDEEERRWVEPRLAGLLGLEEMPAGQREELFAAWRTFFERIADRDPVILVFKDLHWADAGLLEFIEHLLAWSKNHPIYVLAMTRPDLLERHPQWGTGGSQRHHHRARAAARFGRCAISSPASCPVCPRMPSRPSWPGPRACRSTRSRPSACCSTRASSWPMATRTR